MQVLKKINKTDLVALLKSFEYFDYNMFLDRNRRIPQSRKQNSKYLAERDMVRHIMAIEPYVRAADAGQREKWITETIKSIVPLNLSAPQDVAIRSKIRDEADKLADIWEEVHKMLKV